MGVKNLVSSKLPCNRSCYLSGKSFRHISVPYDTSHYASLYNQQLSLVIY